MKKIKNFVASSIENASVFRKFTVFFLIMSFIPTCVLYYLYIQMKNYGSVQLTEANFNMTLTIVVIGVIIGYFAMRAVIKQLMEITQRNTQALKTILSTEDIKEIGKGDNEIAVLAQSFSVITDRLEENLKSLERTKNTLHTVMAKVAQGITSMRNIDTFLQLILETATEALGGNVGVLMIWDGVNNDLQVKSIYGIPSSPEKNNIKIKVRENTTLQMVLSSKQPLIIPIGGRAQGEIKNHDLFNAPLLCSPLIVHDNLVGIISISGKKTGGDFNNDEMNLLLNIASQTAVAIENSKLNQDIEKTYFETISALAMAVDAKDKYSRGHSDRVAEYSVSIGKKLGLEEEEIVTLRDAAKLHDIGKIGIIDDLLSRPGPLNDEEWILMRKHPEIGESIIKPITSLRHLCDIIRHHHEKIDGTGYPDGLKGNEISALVRIATVADIYDALTTDRSYRVKFSRDNTYDMMKKMKDQIDQDIVDVLFEIVDEDQK
ncbi:MAG: HD domain-containing protein [Candidatus Omnitrophica bacterium]|nr:HD domain-containing protein [Candidatus Omnitrophota bacterium]